MYCYVNLKSLKHETYLNNTHQGGNVSTAQSSGTYALVLSLLFKSSRNFKQNTKMNSECVFSAITNTLAEIIQTINKEDS